MKVSEIPNVLQKYKKITIKLATINTFCTISEPNCEYQHQHSKKLNNNRNLRTRFLRFYIFNFYQELEKDITTISITKDGLFYNIDKTLTKIEKIYNIKFNSQTIKEDLHNLKQQIRKIENVEDFGKISSSLKEDYLIFEQITKGYYKRQYKKRSLVEYHLLKTYKSNQIDNINYLLKNLDNNFESIRICNYNLDIIDKDKLNLVIAYQIMNIHQKTKDKNALEYLKEYLIQNESLLKENYTIQKYITNALALTEKKVFSMKAIFQYLYHIMNPIPLTRNNNPSSTSPYNYNFLELSPQKSREILSKYYQLGVSNNTEIELTELLARKVAYYSTLPIKKVLLGKNKFNGYLGFVLEDETVILDKLFENSDECTIAVNEAIYLTDTENFEIVTSFSKTNCIGAIKQKKIKAKRQIHAGNWEDALNKKRLEE